MRGRAPWPAVPFGSFPAFAGAKGAYLHTTDGRRILDAGGQACVSNIGYGREEVAEVAARALTGITHALPPFATPQRLELVDILSSRWLPSDLTRIHLVNSGSEASDAAIRLARQYHLTRGNKSRYKVIGRDVSYHGVTLGALSVSGHAQRRRGFEPILLDTPLAPPCYPLRCGHCGATRRCDLACADALESLIQREGPETVAGFIAEPVVGTSGGAIVPSQGYWARVQEICRKYDVLLIVDEVITGFGRTGLKFGFEHWGIQPDILLLAKGFTGGYAALAALVTTDRVLEPLMAKGEGMMFHTFGGHPAACAVAAKVLEILERENLLERAAHLGEYLQKRLAKLADHRNVAEVRGLGMLHAVEVVRDRKTLTRFAEADQITSKVIAAALRENVLYYFGGTGEQRDIICLAPPFIVNEREIDTMVDVLGTAIEAAVAAA